MDMTSLSFLILGTLAVFLSGVMVTRRYPVAASILLITVFILLAGMYGLLNAHLAAVAQIIVYAGAIMVVFVFVIMLLNLPPEELRLGRLTIGEIALTGVGALGAVLFGTQVGQGQVAAAVRLVGDANTRAPYYPLASGENLRNVAGLMFTDYVWAFELLSLLIFASTVGAIVIARKKKGSTHAEPA